MQTTLPKLRTLMSIGSAIAATPVARSLTIGSLRDPLALFGLERRSSRVLERSALIGAGVLLGAGAALLLAPTSGRETRQRISERANQLTKEAREASERAAGYLQETVDAKLRETGGGTATTNTGMKTPEKPGVRPVSAHS